jgi:hypothetical protein
MKKLAFLIMFVFALIVFTPIASAWSPHSHLQFSKELFAQQESAIIKMCTPYKDSFIAGSVIPDTSVVYYYTAGGKSYKATHNWDFVNKLFAQAKTTDEMCFVYGVAEHEIADSITHTEFVPSLITSYGLSNWVIHPLAEKKYDTIIVAEHPELIEETTHMLDIMFTSKGDRYVEMIENALGENREMDVKSEIVRLGYALGSFYDTLYRPQGSSALFKLYPTLDKFTNAIQPVLGMSNAGKADAYFRKVVEQTSNIYNNWGARYQVSPHGFTELRNADNKSSWWNWVLLVLWIVPALLLVYFYPKIYSKWKKHPMKHTGLSWLWLLLIPGLLIVFILIVYSLI